MVTYSCLVITTCATDTEAQAIATQLIEQKLAACVQLIPIQSVYRWQNEVCREPEVQLLIKTRQSLFGAVEQAIQANHSYDVPEIIALPIIMGSANYLAWLAQETNNLG